MVEGKDDWHVVKAVLRAHGVAIEDERPGKHEADLRFGGATFVVTHSLEEVDGVSTLLQDLPVRLKQSDLQKLAIVVDADEDAERRWQQIQVILTRAGYRSVPPVPEIGGTLVQEPSLPSVGIWLMPNNVLP